MDRAVCAPRRTTNVARYSAAAARKSARPRRCVFQLSVSAATRDASVTASPRPASPAQTLPAGAARRRSAATRQQSRAASHPPNGTTAPQRLESSPARRDRSPIAQSTDLRPEGFRQVARMPELSRRVGQEPRPALEHFGNVPNCDTRHLGDTAPPAPDVQQMRPPPARTGNAVCRRTLAMRFAITRVTIHYKQTLLYRTRASHRERRTTARNQSSVTTGHRWLRPNRTPAMFNTYQSSRRGLLPDADCT